MLNADPFLRDILEPAVEVFFKAAPPGQICVDDIVIGEPDDQFAGRYHHGWSLVEVSDLDDLSDPVAVDHLTTTVWHELCHAADAHLGVPLHTGLDWSLAEDPEDVYSPRLEPSEAFAQHCDRGPMVHQLIGESCPDDPFDTHNIGFVRDWVYPRQLNRVATNTWQWREVGSAEVPGLFPERWLVSVYDDRALEVVTASDSPGIMLGLYTGEPTEGTTRSPPGDWPEVPRGLFADQGTRQGDIAIVNAYAETIHGGRAHRMLLQEGGQWTRLGCARRGEQPFVADEAVWSAWREGNSLHWGVWEH